MAKLQGLKEGKTYYNIYKEEWTQHFPMGLEIYPEVHENPRAFFSSSSPILLESSIQYPWGVGLHHLSLDQVQVFLKNLNFTKWQSQIQGLNPKCNCFLFLKLQELDFLFEITSCITWICTVYFLGYVSTKISISNHFCNSLQKIE